jgi:ankyrin repeat protein
LISSGASISAADVAGMTALDWAQRHGHALVAEALLNTGDAKLYAEERLREDPLAASDYEVSSDDDDNDDEEADGGDGDDEDADVGAGKDGKQKKPQSEKGGKPAAADGKKSGAAKGK